MAGILVLGAGTGKLALGDMLFILISFILLTLAVKHYAWGPVTKMMDARSAKITGDLDYADSERASAEKLKKEREEALRNSRAEAIEIVNKAKDSGDTQKKSIVADAHSEAEVVRQKAKSDAEKAKQDAMSEAQNDIASLSLEIASKVISKELNADDQKSLIDSYIKELTVHNEDK
ncbi:F0F1 ATP synthase subunit B [Companilactobacillus sp.]|jgi:F-type H+-transporting ATPase subunit b|uniref:F0F1 ATP synthase subunit B n=1 Tax=Companilactobacillus sp. TaxID=2767905 RepID=UPI0025B9A49F|nr:F0F1 ATP synthase subunit B [Companilactobacillus sp.]MCH4008484.1 F0F1 ATP synthase subunit B [Companilactobacillus sp.]MCH4051337.1 F0F1 ATP synthase subunit B [Companilactobacillus sp.]MCH4076427.1 F0F1 ATP synthase subunit B [Companilactobacillus sp.]MCH4125002.1 F0F1 ATP synthase subunit B [Companilactobacillus sp.]MCH4131544.1 F0F1 ATP synthase subunit B [Companilactobacillus sp.]